MSLGPGLLAIVVLFVVNFDSSVGEHMEILSPEENGREMEAVHDMNRYRPGTIIDRIVKRDAEGLSRRIHSLHRMAEQGRRRRFRQRGRNRLNRMRGRLQRVMKPAGVTTFFKYCSTPEKLMHLAHLLNDTGNAANYSNFVHRRIRFDVSDCDTTGTVDDEEEDPQRQPLYARHLLTRGRSGRRGHRRGHRNQRRRRPHTLPAYCKRCVFFKGISRLEKLRQIVRNVDRVADFPNLFNDLDDGVDDEEIEPEPEPEPEPANE